MDLPMEDPRNSSHAPLTSKIIDEVRDLHVKSADRSQRSGIVKRRRARRAAREARAAESDLLRVLGFKSYEQFEKSVASMPVKAPRHDRRESSQPAALRVVASQNRDAARSPIDADLWLAREERLDALVGRVAVVEEELAEAKFAIRTARNGVPVEPSAELLDVELEELRRALHVAATELASFAQRVRLECEQLERMRNVTIAAMRDALVTMRGLCQIAALHDD